MANKQATHQNSRWSTNAVLHAPTEVIQEYPLSTALAVFGVGIGVGVLVSATLCDSLLRMMEPQPTMAERWSKQFYDTLSHAVPEAVSRRFAA